MTPRTLRARLDALTDVERPEGFELATLTRYDVPALAALYLVAYESPEIAENLWTATDEMRMAFDGVFGNPRDDSFVGAWQDGELVGAVLCVTDATWDDVPRGPFILDIMVDPDHRRRGIATALVVELARRCRTWGYDDISLRVDQKRAAGAERLYEIIAAGDATDAAGHPDDDRPDTDLAASGAAGGVSAGRTDTRTGAAPA